MARSMTMYKQYIKNKQIIVNVNRLSRQRYIQEKEDPLQCKRYIWEWEYRLQRKRYIERCTM